jgi:glycosyltransferase involved in cell wall biosynthesis
MKVTVGICCYKQKKWLHRCLRSLANQFLKKDEFEVVICNDDPEEDLSDVCDNMKNELNIRLINNFKNLGLPASLNKILKTAKGRYFVRVDSDDYVSRHFLYALSLILDMNRNYQAAACDYNIVNEVGSLVESCSAEEKPIACGVMFTYESLCEINFYDENFRMREGHNLIKRFLKNYKLFNLPIPLYRYRIHNSNRTHNISELLKYDNLLNKEAPTDNS